ncbi:Putative 2-aminoethylphosphonate transport system permease protein PhnV [Pseudooceanicola marinus]|uniref:Putative 2-aminoethylphosphonate transport system permease protein PhnV n=1 Tax=Pseudooceanicola marinus TaxID=396013 RepID=A0A1X7AA91_9RHOB|nr:iron ABC transporter permease [Pseudooceanicola marinus]SLN73898.1 Putative 2-aminoethylphosphonate transport system permease protein PhnV [Pseudooceanicola marinus]
MSATTDTSSEMPGGRFAARHRFQTRYIYIGLLIAFLAFITLFPLGMLVYGSFHTGSPSSPESVVSLDGYRAVFSAGNLEILWNTLYIAGVKSVFSLLIAAFLAWIVARTDTPMRGLLEVLITLPFFIPPILTAMAWSLLGNAQTGPINMLWRSLTGSSEPLIDVYSTGGVIWHMMQYAIPFMFLFLVESFRRMDPSLEEASRMCGASRMRTLRGITLRLMIPVMATVFTLSFIRGMESFESPLFFGTPAGVRVVATEIYNAINQDFTPNYQFATAIAIVVMGLMLLLLLAQRAIIGGRNYQTVSGKGYRPGVMALGRWRWATFAFCLLFFFLSVVLPVGQLFIGSFYKYIGFYDTKFLTLEHYRNVFENRAMWDSVLNTMILGLGGATLTMLLGSMVAYISIRTRWHGRRLIDFMAWLPWLMPGIVLGVGFLWAFAYLPGPITIYGTLWALLLAYIAICMPLGVNAMSTAFVQLSVDLEECSRVHGASFLQTMSRILIALAWPSFAIGWLLCFFVVMRELSASVLLYSVGNEVMSVEMLKLWENGRAEEVCVLSMFMILLVVAFRGIQIFVTARRTKLTQ